MPLGRKLAGSFALCDESFALFSLSRQKNYPFLLGANTAMYIFFVLSTAAGCFLADILPQLIINSFGIAFYAAFLAMLLPSVQGNRSLLLLVILTAGLNWLLGCFLPGSWAVILSMLAGALLGGFLVPDTAEQEVSP